MPGFDNITEFMTDKLTQDLNSLRIERHKKTGDGGGRKWMVLGAIALIALAVAALVAFMPAGTGLADLGTKAREVGITLVARQLPSADNIVLTAGGYIIPRRRIEVSSKISGRVERLLVEKGEAYVPVLQPGGEIDTTSEAERDRRAFLGRHPGKVVVDESKGGWRLVIYRVTPGEAPAGAPGT